MSDSLTPWTVAYQASLCVGFPRQEYQDGTLAISYSRGPSQPRDQTQVSALQADTLPSEPPGESKQEIMKGKHGIVPWPCVPWVLETVLSEFFTTAFDLLGNSANEIVDLCVFVSPWLESFKINFLKPNTRIWLPS